MTDLSNDEDDQLARERLRASTRIIAEVEDALHLANYVVSTGFRGMKDLPPPFPEIGVIQATAMKLGLIDVLPSATEVSPKSITVRDWNKFEQAYFKLAAATYPVTAESLRDTRDTARSPGSYASRAHRLFGAIWGYSPAQRFARELWFLTIIVVVAVIDLEWALSYLSRRVDQPEKVADWYSLWSMLLPWFYGALGACMDMLKNAHYHIHRRSFDTRRTPEYFNRILLGMLTGGACVQFIESVAEPDTALPRWLVGGIGISVGFFTGSATTLVNRVTQLLGKRFWQ